jgi:hypothetical protein
MKLVFGKKAEEAVFQRKSVARIIMMGVIIAMEGKIV